MIVISKDDWPQTGNGTAFRLCETFINLGGFSGQKNFGLVGRGIGTFQPKEAISLAKARQFRLLAALAAIDWVVRRDFLVA